MWTSSLGKKYVMAVTGLFLLGFLLAHLLGNLQIFLGPDWLNGYAEHLKNLPLVAWPARGILSLCLLAHFISAALLAAQNKKARPISYKVQDTVRATLASRTMVASGLGVFFFVVYHLLHATWGVAHPQFFHLTDAQGRHDVYSMMILSFQNPLIAGTYVTALLVLSTHAGHASSSFLQSLGWTPRGAERKMTIAGQVFGWFLFIGYASIPVSAWAGYLKPLQGGH